MNKLIYILAFAVGAGAGSAIAWHLTKKKCEERCQQDIDSVKEYYAHRAENVDISKETTTPIEDTQTERRFQDLTERYSAPAEKAPKKSKDGPYVISPDELGEFPDYGVISLTYYADGVLADENDEMIEDPDDIIGPDALNHFGEYEDDSVAVRNDQKQCDYEILQDLRRYSEILESKPWLKEGL